MVVLGENKFRYEGVAEFGQLPPGWRMGGEVPGVATDSQDRVYVTNRSEHPVIVFDREGKFIGSWGEGIFTSPHGITITPDDIVYCTDDRDHTVRKFTTSGELLQTIGTPNHPSDTGCDMKAGYRLTDVKRGGPPFNRPTKVTQAAKGDLYVTDGYGNSRVHRFTHTGNLIQSWGEPGEEPGQFNLPHSIWYHSDGRLFVCDRENSRVQIFSLLGEYLGGWNVIGRPQELLIDQNNNVFIAVRPGNAGERTMAGRVMTETVPSHICICDIEGNLLGRLGGTNIGEIDSFVSAHGICMDSRGDIYVGEIGHGALKKLGINKPNYQSLRKLVRLEPVGAFDPKRS